MVPVGLGVFVILLLAPLPKGERWIGAFFDAAHLVLGAAVATFAYLALRRRGATRVVAASCGWLIAFVALGLFEGAQSFVGRNTSLADAIANGVGALIAMVIALGWTHARGWAIGMATLLLLVGLVRPVFLFIDALAQKREFPLIASFDHELEMTRWSTSTSTIERDTRHATHGSHSLRVDLGSAPWPGCTMRSPPRDWHPETYARLEIDVYIEGDTPMEFTVKVVDEEFNDTYEDGFHFERPLSPGAHTLNIALDDIRRGPKTRKMSLRKVRALQLFASNVKGSRAFYVDRIELMQ